MNTKSQLSKIQQTTCGTYIKIGILAIIYFRYKRRRTAFH